jgi:hypothetical protein
MLKPAMALAEAIELFNYHNPSFEKWIDSNGHSSDDSSQMLEELQYFPLAISQV